MKNYLNSLLHFLTLTLLWIGSFVPAHLWANVPPPFPPFPQEVSEFEKKRDLCDHFRGEEAYDEERAKEIAEAYKKYCTGTDLELARLKQKYKNETYIMDLLKKYEERIE